MAVRVREDISFDDPPGVAVVLKAGHLLPDDHPYVRGREHLFESADAEAARSFTPGVAVETATAAPGERRSVTRPRKSVVGDPTGSEV